MSAGKIVIDHTVQCLTRTARHQRVVSDWLHEINTLYDLLIFNRNVLHEANALDDLQNVGRHMLELASEECEVTQTEIDGLAEMLAGTNA